MTRIEAYDIDASLIYTIAEENDTTEANVIEAILTAINDNYIDIKDYL